MKVLFITRGYPSEKDPMKGNYEAVQAKAIAAKGHEVSVIGVKVHSLLHLHEMRKYQHCRVQGMNVYTIESFMIFDRLVPFIPKTFLPKVNFWLFNRAFKKLFKIYLAENGMPDVVHIHSLHSAPPVVYLKKHNHVPVVITEHWSKVKYQNVPARLKNRIDFWGNECYCHADSVVAVSDSLAQAIHERFGIQCRVINNMVQDRFFKHSKAMNQHRGFRFISVGSLFPIKGYDVLIEAFSKIARDREVSLDIVGKGTENERLQQLIAKYGQEERIHLTGVKTPDEVADMLETSDCFVLASKSETFGIVYIEAMAKGLPVIATRCGGPEEFVNKDNGLLVDVGNCDALTEAMVYMMDHKNLYNKEKIRQFCLDHYSESAIADQLIKEYHKVIKNK